jgi:hypothetical protein
LSDSSEDNLEDIVVMVCASISEDLASHQTVIRPPPVVSFPLDIMTSTSKYDPSSDASTSDELSDDECQAGNIPHPHQQQQTPQVKQVTNF